LSAIVARLARCPAVMSAQIENVDAQFMQNLYAPLAKELQPGAFAEFVDSLQDVWTVLKQVQQAQGKKVDN
jgi:hypothetical protein